MLNMDMNQRVVIDTNAMEWQPSPAAGVLRKPLAREGAEHGHATSIVKYEPGSSFKSHEHPFGEEILVLEGVFSDESGDYQQGSYFRNPPGSSHAPSSAPGCTLFVKLHQFQKQDKEHVCIDTRTAEWTTGDSGQRVMPLHRFGSEQVCLVKILKGEPYKPLASQGGEEIYVLSGSFADELGNYPVGTWLRSPKSSQEYPPFDQDTLIWVKTGHLEQG